MLANELLALHQQVTAGLGRPVTLAFGRPSPGLVALGRPGESPVITYDQGRLWQLPSNDFTASSLAGLELQVTTRLPGRNAAPCNEAAGLWEAWQRGLCQIALARGRAALDYMVQYSRTRHAFGQPIGKHQMVMERLAAIAVDLATVEAVLAEPGVHPRAGWVMQTVARATGEACKLGGGHGYLTASPLAELLQHVTHLANLGEGCSHVRL